jgi:hypothetical protein
MKKIQHPSKNKKIRTQINEKFNNTSISIFSDGNKTKYITAAISSCQKLKSRVSFTQPKPILDIFSRGFSLSSCPQLPLAPKSHLSIKVYTEVRTEFIFHISIRII